MTDQEWDFVEGLVEESCGFFETGLDLTAQKDGTHFPASLSRCSKFPTHPYSKAQGHLGQHFSTPVASFDMNRKFTAEQIDKLREVDRMRKRATMSAWLNAGIHINDEHQAASAKPADPAPDKYAEVNRMKLRNEYLSWIFGGVHIDNFHEDWDRMSPAAKDALRGEVSGGQQLSDEQVG